MAVTNSEDLLRGGMDRAVELMAIAANTVMKFGKPHIKISAIGPEEYVDIAGYCEGLAEISPLFYRDAKNFMYLAETDGRSLLIGAKRKSVYNFDCGACGFRTCKELNKAETVESIINGPCCHFVVYDVHMAANAAASVAWYMGLHCRVFQTIGAAAPACGFIDDVDFCVGVAVSYLPLDPFFDRHKYWTKEEWDEKFAKEFPSFVRRFMGAAED